MNKFKFFIFNLLFLGAISAYAGNQPIQISGEFGTCTPQDSFRIFAFVGTTLQQLAATPLAQQGDKYVFSINVNGMEKGFYFIGMKPNAIVPIILGDESPIHISGNCNTFASNLMFTGSRINKEWNDIQQRINALNQEANTCIQYFHSFPEDAVDLTIKERLRVADMKKRNLVDSLKKADPFLAKLAGLNVTLSYHMNKRPNETEADYYARSYFEFVDLSDPDFNRIHLLAQAASKFAGLMTVLPFFAEEKIAICEKLLNQTAKNSNAHTLLLNSFADAFNGNNDYRQRNDDAFYHFANLYLKDYAHVNPQITQNYRQAMEAIATTLNGKLAPDFKQATPDGKSIGPADFKGKVLVIDFWASWCKPCRKENPNVVKMYNKLKGQGLEILSVSLDSDRAAWLAAIEKDGLIWNHVSDLAAWGNAVAKQYKVTGVPFTVIVDKKGVIREKNLRGEQLEKKVAELLQEK